MKICIPNGHSLELVRRLLSKMNYSITNNPDSTGFLGENNGISFYGYKALEIPSFIGGSSDFDIVIVNQDMRIERGLHSLKPCHTIHSIPPTEYVFVKNPHTRVFDNSKTLRLGGKYPYLTNLVSNLLEGKWKVVKLYGNEEQSVMDGRSDLALCSRNTGHTICEASVEVYLDKAFYSRVEVFINQTQYGQWAYHFLDELKYIDKPIPQQKSYPKMFLGHAEIWNLYD